MTLALPTRPSDVRQGRRAGFVSRVAADGIDLVVLELIFAGCLVGMAVARYLLTSDPLRLPDPPIWFTSVAQFVLATAYLAWGWGSTGRSPGKALLGLRVVTDHGHRLGQGRATARAALCVLVGPVLLLWALVSSRDAGVHDLLLSTAVIHDWQPRRRLAVTPPQ